MRAPRGRLRWRRRARPLRWPAGMALAGWRWLWHTTPIRRVQLDEDASLRPRLHGAEGSDVQRLGDGEGPRFHRRYSAVVVGGSEDPQGLIGTVARDLNAASPTEVAVFDKTCGDPGDVAVGDEYLIHMPGPWDGPVRVIARTPTTFRFATLEGHLEAGEIEFRAEPAEGGLRFVIESWARSGDLPAHVLYDKLGVSQEMQLHMWAHFCERVATLCGGRLASGVEVATGRVDGSQDG